MRINEDFIKEKIDDECILVPTGEGYQNGVFKLNETAERIFDLIGEGKKRDDVIRILCEEYDTDTAEATGVVDGFMTKLRQAKIIIDN